MARIRYIKPSFPEDEKLAPAVSRDARLFYILSWCWMDKQGLIEDSPKVMKRNIFPYDEDIGVEQVTKMIEELKAARRLFSLEWNGIKLLYCPTMRKHQKFHRGEGPKYSIPEEKLKEFAEHPASTLLAPDLHPTSTVQAPDSQPSSTQPAAFNAPSSSAGNWNGELGTGNGQLVTGIGTGTGTGNGELEPRELDHETLAAQDRLIEKRKALGLSILGFAPLRFSKA